MKDLTLEIPSIVKSQNLPAEKLDFRLFGEYLTVEARRGDDFIADYYLSVLNAFTKIGVYDAKPDGPSAPGADPEALSAEMIEKMTRLVARTFVFTLDREDQFSVLLMPVTHENLEPESPVSKLAGRSAVTPASQARALLPAESNGPAYDQLKHEVFRQLFTNRPDQHRITARLAYLAIWRQYRGCLGPLQEDLIIPCTDSRTGLKRYYSFKIDLRFLAVKTALSDSYCLEVLNEAESLGGDRDTMLQMLGEKLMLTQFEFSGFRRFEVRDVTVAQIIKITAEASISQRTETASELKYSIYDSLNTLAGTTDIEFELIPLLKVNDSYTFNDSLHNKEPVDEGGKQLFRTSLFEFLVTAFLPDPKRRYLKEITDDFALRHPYLGNLKKDGVVSYALIPVSFKKETVGVLELFSRKPDTLDKSLLFKLEPAIPMLSFYFKHCIDEFEQQMDVVILEKFTYLQPAVMWKFNQAAWHYIRDKRSNRETAEIETIQFNDIYPFYGAVDIRNSTVNRNEALQKDLLVQLNILYTTLNSLKSITGFALLDEKIYATRLWLERLSAEEAVFQESALSNFFELEINLFLDDFLVGNPALQEPVETYRSSLDSKNGIATENRRQLEMAMNVVIEIISNEVEAINIQAQQDYPCFFEKFKTDGVEYDIYIGQQITPQKPFRSIYIHNLRLLQLKSMISVARQTHDRQHSLPRPIEITELIFVHSSPIDIKFRNDERRFDVEGSYNIRYQVVKKRIDKAFIDNSTERLTEPGKIVLVYFNQQEIDEFLVHIRFLQQQSLLNDDLEWLDIEPLQGVTGLKALRVGIKLV